MTTMTTYPHGVPSWIDLATPDPAASKAFYSELFGWEYSDEPTDQPGVDYTMARSAGRDAAGIMQWTEQMAAAGMPPVWTPYVTVDDLDATVAKVQPAGGTVLQPPIDVMDAGRMAVIADSTGAVLALWTARSHIGCGVVNEHGALAWTELMTPDPAAAAAFYENVLGWTAQTVPMPTGEYTVFHVAGGNEQGIAGAMAPPMAGVLAYWGIYFRVDDAAATVARAESLGAKVLMPATEMPGVGTLAALTDPQGAVFSVMTPQGAPA